MFIDGTELVTQLISKYIEQPIVNDCIIISDRDKVLSFFDFIATKLSLFNGISYELPRISSSTDFWFSSKEFPFVKNWEQNLAMTKFTLCGLFKYD